MKRYYLRAQAMATINSKHRLGKCLMVDAMGRVWPSADPGECGQRTSR